MLSNYAPPGTLVSARAALSKRIGTLSKRYRLLVWLHLLLNIVTALHIMLITTIGYVILIQENIDLALRLQHVGALLVLLVGGAYWSILLLRYTSETLDHLHKKILLLRDKESCIVVQERRSGTFLMKTHDEDPAISKQALLDLKDSQARILRLLEEAYALGQ